MKSDESLRSKTIRTSWRWLWLSIVALAAISQARADDKRTSSLGIDVNVYPHQSRIDSDTDLTVIANAGLPGRFSYFSFLNYVGAIGSGDMRLDRSEQNLRWGLSETSPLDLNAQAILVAGDGNDMLQLGISVRAHDVEPFESFFRRMNLVYRLTFHVKRFSSTDADAWQMEHFFRMTFPGLSDRLYLTGFLDQTFGLDAVEGRPSKPIVSEVQLGWRVYKGLHAVAEYRINEFRLENEENLAIGVEYQFRW